MWNSERSEYRTLFNMGCLIGLICFIAIYGVRILDFTYDAWLLNGDMDLRQHYIGWCHFRMDKWSMPIGLIDSLSYPTRVSVIYTDSIPLFAVFFKLFAHVLPERFQYFGLFGLLSFTLQGGLAAIIVRRFVNKRWICLLSCAVFVLNFPILQRMYYHTALAAQWIILLALLLWFYDDRLDSTIKKCLAWFGMGALCVFIHSYFLPMAGLILLASFAEQWIGKKETVTAQKQRLWQQIKILCTYCVSALIALAVLGAFYGGASAVGEGLGTFCSNLNTFINPLGMGRVFASEPLYYDFQYEGFGYLGAGVLLLVCISVIIVIILYVKKKPRINRIFFRTHCRVTVIIVLFVVFCILAVFPIVTWNQFKLFGVPYPSFVRKLLNVFRSNGRFIWVPVYLITLSVIVVIDRYLLSFVGKLVFAAAFAIQLYDISAVAGQRRACYDVSQSYETMWEENELKQILKGRNEFVFMYDDNDIIMETAYCAYLHGMRQNNYYYARDISALVASDINRWKEELKNGIVRKNVIYIFKQEDFDETKFQGLEFVYANEHVFAVAKQDHRKENTKKGQLPF